MPREAAGRGQHFQDRFLIPRKVITGQIPCQITRHVTRQIIKIIISHGFMGTVAISYQVAITFPRKANLRLSSQHFYINFKVKSLLVLYFKGALQRCFAPL